MTARTELAELIAHPTGVSAGLTISDVVRDAQDMAVNIRSVSEQEAADMLATLASLLDEVVAIVRDAPSVITPETIRAEFAAFVDRQVADPTTKAGQRDAFHFALASLDDIIAGRMRETQGGYTVHQFLADMKAKKS